jgi:hypothetical protein
MQADKPHERGASRSLDSPKTKPAVVELRLDAYHERIALLSAERRLHVSHHLGIGVECGKRLEVFGPPAP